MTKTPKRLQPPHAPADVPVKLTLLEEATRIAMTHMLLEKFSAKNEMVLGRSVKRATPSLPLIPRA